MKSTSNKGYFNLESTLKKYKVDWQTDSCIFCVNAIRNVGKTTSALNWLMPQINQSRKIGFIRNNEEQLKAFKQDFNSRFAGKFMISGIMVYEVNTVTELDDDGNEITKYSKGHHVGYCGSISTYTKIKSIEAANIRYILFDEYNEADLAIRQIYVKWINMIKTLTRFNKVFILMLGNRDTPNNEFMVKWGVLPQTDEFYSDYFVKFSDRGYFLEMGSKQFDDLENDKTLANELAQFDNDSKRYLEGGYAQKMTLQVVPYYVIIHNTFNPLFKVCLKGNIIAFGEFTHKIYGKVFCLVQEKCAIDKATSENLQTFSLDSLSYQSAESKLNTQESIYNIVEKIFRLHKKRKLFYDSFDILSDMIDKMLIIKY